MLHSYHKDFPLDIHQYLYKQAKKHLKLKENNLSIHMRMKQSHCCFSVSTNNHLSMVTRSTERHLTHARHTVTLMKSFHSGRGKKTINTDARIVWYRVETGCIMTTQSWALQTLVNIFKKKRKEKSQRQNFCIFHSMWCLCSITYHNTLQKNQQRNLQSLLMTGNHPNTGSKSCRLCSYTLHCLHRCQSHRDSRRCFHIHRSLHEIHQNGWKWVK